MPDKAQLRPVEDHGPPIMMTSDRVLLKRPGLEGDRKSKGGLLIPATAATVSKKCIWAEVVAVGPNVRHMQPGDQALILPDSGLEVEIRGEEYLLLREREVHAVASPRHEGSPTGLYL